MIVTVILLVGLLVAAIVVGQTVLRMMGCHHWTWLAPAVGLAVMLLIATATEFMPGGALTSFVALLLATITSGAVVVRSRDLWPDVAGLAAGAPLFALVALPFAAAGGMGILGKSFNNDMGNHLAHVAGLMPEGAPGLRVWDSLGYPTGPHGLVAALSTGTGAPSHLVFSAFSMSLPILLGWTALHALTRGYRWSAFPTTLVVGGSFMVAAYFAQGSFKENALAVFVLAMALYLWRPPSLARPARWLPYAVLAAGALAVYSYVGLIWPALLLVSWGVCRITGATWQARSLRPIGAAARANAVPAILGLFAVVILTIPVAGRVRRFMSWEGLPVDNLGNLVGALPFWQVLGNWNSADFRIDGPYSTWTTLGAMMMGIAVIAGAAWALWHGDWMTVLAPAMGTLVWVWADHTQSPYVASKTLAVLAPLVLLLAVRPLVERPPSGVRMSRVLQPLAAGVLVVIGLAPSVSTLRAAPVDIASQADELSGIAADIGNRRALYLGNDDFTPWLFRGTAVESPVIAAQVSPFRRSKPFEYGVAYDVDSVPARALVAVDFVVTPRDAAASRMPAAFTLARRTDHFDVYRRIGPAVPRFTLPGETGWASGSVLDCSSPVGARIRAEGGVAGLRPPEHSAAGPTLPPGGNGSITLPLAAGTWDLVAAYTAPRPVIVSGPGMLAELPAYLGRPGPRWPVAKVTVTSAGPYTVEFHATRNWLSPQAGAPGSTPTQIIRVTAVRSEPARVVPIARACGQVVDWYASAKQPSN